MIILEPLTPQFPHSVFASLPLSTLTACDPAYCGKPPWKNSKIRGWAAGWSLRHQPHLVDACGPQQGRWQALHDQSSPPKLPSLLMVGHRPCPAAGRPALIWCFTSCVPGYFMKTKSPDALKVSAFILSLFSILVTSAYLTLSLAACTASTASCLQSRACPPGCSRRAKHHAGED